VLERLERAEADIATSLADLTGTLRIASFQTAALALVPPMLTDLRDAHPRLRVQLTQMEPEQSLPALLARDFDLVIAEEYPGCPSRRPPELERESLCDDTLRLGLPAATATDTASPDEALRALAGHPWVMQPEGTPARHWAVALCRDAGFEPDVRFESSDPLLHLRLVEQGHATALLPDLLWRGRRPTVPLRQLPAGRRARTLFTVVRRGRGGHPAIVSCRRALLRACGPAP
jgi:DNA-binding transcriptional LysR family regulator